MFDRNYLLSRSEKEGKLITWGGGGGGGGGGEVGIRSPGAKNFKKLISVGGGGWGGGLLFRTRE